MARELVTEKGVGEKADACWREVQRQQTRMLENQRAETIEQPQEPAAPGCATEGAAPTPQPPPTTEVLAEFVSRPPKLGRRPRFTSDDQLSLAF
jgi:hypothetical protein